MQAVSGDLKTAWRLSFSDEMRVRGVYTRDALYKSMSYLTFTTSKFQHRPTHTLKPFTGLQRGAAATAASGLRRAAVAAVSAAAAVAAAAAVVTCKQCSL